MDYFDLHCDTVSNAFNNGLLPDSTQLQTDVQNKCRIEKYNTCFALFINDKLSGNDAFEKAKKLYDFYGKNFSHINCRPLLTLENCRSFAGKEENILFWKNAGVSMATLTWNGENELGFGADCPSGGLKKFGKEAVAKMQEYKIAVDVSHLNEDGFKDVCRISKKPFAASHSNCHAVCPHKRNLKDWQVREIINRRGIIGICFYPLFLGKGDVFENIYEHICHILELGGEKSIAIGSDFDGAKMSRKLDRTEKVPILYEYLKGKGLDKELVDDIFFQNAENFFNSVSKA